MEYRGRVQHVGGTIAGTSAPTVSPQYGSIEAALAAIAESVFVDLSDTIGDASLRVNLWLAGTHISPDDKTMLEDLYLVLPDNDAAAAENTPGVQLLKLGTHTATLGTVAITGIAGGHTHAKSAAFSTTGVLEALSGGLIAPQVFPASGTLNGAGLVIHDRLSALGLLRAPYRGTATTGIMRQQLWR